MFSLIFKWVSVLVLIATTVAFELGFFPPYHTFSNHDKSLWILLFGVLAVVQTLLLVCKVRKCCICRVWSDFTLQLTGMAFVVLAGAFGAEFPPFSWAMGVFPVIGVLYLVVGRVLSQRSRKLTREYNGCIATD